MEDERIGDFWDARAVENPLYYIDNRLDYANPDAERFWRGGPASLEAMLERLGTRIEDTDEVLEIGCGVGRITRVLAARAARVQALDVSRAMLEQAAELNPDLTNVEWILGDGSSLVAVGDASVDVCHSDVVFQHIPEPAVTLGYVREIGRVLRPEGWAGLQISNDPEVHRPRARGRGPAALWAALRGGLPRGQDHPAWLGSAVGLNDLEKAAAAGQMTLERVVGQGTQFCHVLLRKRTPVAGR